MRFASESGRAWWTRPCHARSTSPTAVETGGPSPDTMLIVSVLSDPCAVCDERGTQFRGSAIHLQDNARPSGVYAAGVVGRHGDLYVRIGGNDAHRDPSGSGYGGY